MREVQRKFEQLAREALARAEAVECTAPEFVEGLARMIDTLEGARQHATKACLPRPRVTPISFCGLTGCRVPGPHKH